MKLESYFEFLADDDVRIKGTRIGIETVLYDYIYKNQTAEQIAENYPSLTLSQVYATILYYLNNRRSVEKYLLDWLNFSQKMREAQQNNPSSIVRRLQKLKAEHSKVAA
jgi:uncharacterized protein (DUF433 family)